MNNRTPFSDQHKEIDFKKSDFHRSFAVSLLKVNAFGPFSLKAD